MTRPCAVRSAGSRARVTVATATTLTVIDSAQSLRRRVGDAPAVQDPGRVHEHVDAGQPWDSAARAVSSDPPAQHRQVGDEALGRRELGDNGLRPTRRSRPPTTTWCVGARSRAMARPMPRVPPVTTATGAVV